MNPESKKEGKPTKGVSKQCLEKARTKCLKELGDLFDETTPMYINSPDSPEEMPDPEEMNRRMHLIMKRFASTIKQPEPSEYAIENAMDLLCEQCMDADEENVHPSYLFHEWQLPNSPILDLIEDIIAGIER